MVRVKIASFIFVGNLFYTSILPISGEGGGRRKTGSFIDRISNLVIRTYPIPFISVLYFGNVYGSTWHQFDFSSIVDPLISYLGLGFGSAPNSDAIDEKTRLELLLSADDLSKAARNTIDLAPLTPGTNVISFISKRELLFLLFTLIVSLESL